MGLWDLRTNLVATGGVAPIDPFGRVVVAKGRASGSCHPVNRAQSDGRASVSTAGASKKSSAYPIVALGVVSAPLLASGREELVGAAGHRRNKEWDGEDERACVSRAKGE